MGDYLWDGSGPPDPEVEELEKALDQLRKAQDQLVVQQKLASLGSLTAGIAHEIKNPLNFVTNFAEVSVSLVNELRESTEGQSAHLDAKELKNIRDILDDLQQNVAKIQQHGKRADGIVRNMLMHSRGHSGEHQPTNLNSLLAEYVKLAYHGMRAQNQNFNVTIQEQYDPTLEPVSVVAHDLGRDRQRQSGRSAAENDQDARGARAHAGSRRHHGRVPSLRW